MQGTEGRSLTREKYIICNMRHGARRDREPSLLRFLFSQGKSGQANQGTVLCHVFTRICVREPSPNLCNLCVMCVREPSPNLRYELVTGDGSSVTPEPRHVELRCGKRTVPCHN